MIASRIVVVSEVVAELAFRMKFPGIHDVDVSALYPKRQLLRDETTHDPLLNELQSFFMQDGQTPSRNCLPTFVRIGRSETNWRWNQAYCSKGAKY